MDEKRLSEELEKMNAQTPSQDVKVRAVASALEEFDAVSQENGASGRPNSEVTKFRSRKMDTTNEKWAYGGLASAAMVMLGVVFVYNVTGPMVEQGTIEMQPQIPALSSDIVQFQDEEVRAAGEQVQLKTQDAARQLTKKKERIAYAPAAEMDALGGLRMAAEPVPVQPQYVGRDVFEAFKTNAIKRAINDPVSTFSIDVDTASYSFVRRQLNQGVLPQKAAVRLEEMVNYFPYAYPLPESREVPFSTNVSVMDSPWNEGNKLVHIGIKGYEHVPTEQSRSNIVFLLDVSGSMSSPDKLPLVKQSMGMLLDSLQPEDTVAIAVYAGAAGTVLEPTPVKEKQKIMNALGRLNAGGSTAGAAGIRLAYQLAEANFVKGGVNRIFLATDGDFNVGITNRDELQGFIERKRDSGIYLSVLGFGQGNYQDALMQKLAQNGNGIAAYIDTLSEAQKVLVDEATSNLFPIANDVKIQVEFNPATVSEYRLLGYETRLLKSEDFNNDAVDAGEIGAGHSVTAIYEITPVGQQGLIDASRYSSGKMKVDASLNEYGFLKMRYKLPGESTSRLIEQPIDVEGATGNQESRFAVAVAGFAQLLKDSKYIGDWSYDDALRLATANRGSDEYGYRAEFTQLVRKAKLAEEMR